MRYFKRESWGYSEWRGKVQVGVGVGLDLFQFRGFNPTKMQYRIWNKRGIFKP